VSLEVIDSHIFLDFDGVIWSEDFRRRAPDRSHIDNDPIAMARVAKLAQIAAAGVIITSSWRIGGRSLETMKDILARSGAGSDLTSRVIGLTPELATGWGDNRGQEIAAWRDAQEQPIIENYVILDDFSRKRFLKDQRSHLVRTTIEHGFTEDDYQKALKVLGVKH
jgi:hypothetical protein